MAPCMYCGGDVVGKHQSTAHVNCTAYFQQIRWDDEYKGSIKAAVDHIKAIRVRNIENNKEAAELAASARRLKHSLVENDRLQTNTEAKGERSAKRRCQ